METKEQWPKIKQILGAALECAPAERAAFLDQACELDHELRREVESLLAAHADGGGLSEQPWVPHSPEPETAKTIGPYHLIRQIGAGGMGQVWLAEQTSPVRRRVALKLIRAGVYDGAVVQRFQAERQSLALMDHPAIAKVFDAGATSEGQPYLVMEYVDGLPITGYCDQKKITIKDRLHLFMRVCEGVQHAHRKAIIHRDLKPSNILVTEVDGKPLSRIIDFGLAKAIEGFNAALGEDATCGIAYWGIALSDWSNPFAPEAKDKSQLQAGRENAERGKTVGAKTERERAYLEAVGKLYSDYENTPQRIRLMNYRDAMQRVATKYPEDHEAQIFYALAITASEDLADKTYAGRLKAGAILEKLFEQEPEHPGLAHYIIHTYDVPALAGRALAAARRYAEIAPDAPHALHMPSHTFTRTGYWQESIDTNIAAAAAARREGQTAEELHATDYELYAYLQTGQDNAARRITESLPEVASRFDPKAVLSGAGGPAVGYFALAAIPARYALERQDWKQAAQLTVYETPFPHTDAMTWFARGLSAARLGNAGVASESATALQHIRERLAKAGEDYWAQQVEIQEMAVRAWAAFAKGQKVKALRQMASAAELEDGSEKSAVTPGPLKPAHELLGEMLLEMNKPAQALDQFEATLKKEPGRFRALYGAAHAAQLSGNRDASQKYFRKLLNVCVHADKPGRSEITEAGFQTALKP